MGNDIDKIVEDAMGEIGKYYSLVHAVTLKNADQLIRDILRSACEKAREAKYKEGFEAGKQSIRPSGYHDVEEFYLDHPDLDGRKYEGDPQ